MLVFNKFLLYKKIGSGSFGDVFHVILDNGNLAAAKVESKKKQKRIHIEYNIYKKLNNKNLFIPKIYSYIQTKDYNILIMELLGPNLEEVLLNHNKNLKINSVIYIGIKIFGLIKQFHESGYIHRDIKPNNFLLGNRKKSEIYIMDFGLSKKYINKNNEHININFGRSLIGTTRYASINMHNGVEPSRRDDIESICYMLIYLAKGSLPWQGIKNTCKKTHIDQTGEIKKNISISELCKDLPNCFMYVLKYSRCLDFYDNPDYDFLINSFLNFYDNTLPLEWIEMS